MQYFGYPGPQSFGPRSSKGGPGSAKALLTDNQDAVSKVTIDNFNTPYRQNDVSRQLLERRQLSDVNFLRCMTSQLCTKQSRYPCSTKQ